MFHNRYDCKIVSRLGTLDLNTDPIGVNKTELLIGRSEKTYGIFLKEILNVEFTDKAKDYLQNLYQLDGINAVAKLIKKEKNENTDEWFISSEGFLDFTTRKIEENKLKINYVEGGLRNVLASQAREKFELNRTTDINGNFIPSLLPDKLLLKGREIFLLSTLESKETTFFTILSGGYQGGYRDAFRPAPLTVVANSDPENIVTPFEYINEKGGHKEGEATEFFLKADTDKGKTVLKVSMDFVFQDVRYVFAPKDRNLKVVLRRYSDQSSSGGSGLTFEEEDVLIDCGDPDFIARGTSFSVPSFTKEFSVANNNEINAGDSFALYFKTTADYATIGDDLEHMDIDISNYSCRLSWSEDSFYSQTTASVLRAFDVGNRLTEIYTGKPAFKSSLLDTDYWKHLVMSCGFWIRNMKKKIEEGVTEERTMTISFEDFYKSIHALEPVGYGIITEGNQQYIALEKLRYFFQPVKTIKLGQVSKLKREAANDFVFSSISTGYLKGGNYEKPLGLDEYNISTNYITPIHKDISSYEVLGSSRADSYAVEQARRMQYENYPDEDTPYDKDNFLIDAKLANRSNQKNYFEVRTWEDDFQAAPTGIYSPETAFNLRLSPKRNLLRHSYWFNSGTVKSKNDNLRRTNTLGNVELNSVLIGEEEVSEKTDVPILDLSNPIFEPEWITFEVPYTQELLDKIQGHTKIGEENINNFYGLVEFLNEQGIKEKGYLFEVKSKDVISFRLIKAFD